MANTLGFDVTIGNLPDGYTAATLQALLDKIGELIEINLDEEYGIFKVGASAPDALTQVAWLRNGTEWYVPDGSGNWVPATINADYKRIYVQVADPADSATIQSQSLWVETDTDGITVKALKVRLSSAWRTVGFSKSDLDTLKARVDSVIETSSPYGLKEDVVEYDNLADATIASLKNEILGSVYPIGGLFLSAVSTNPEDLLGFGTWEAYGQGRAIVGAGSGTGLTSRALGSEFGVEEVTLTAAQSGVPEHTHEIRIPKSTDFGSTKLAGDGVDTTSGTIVPFDSQTNTAADAASAHTNTQPSVAVSVWRRTA